MKEQYLEALSFIKKYYREQPEIGIILGTGLGGLTNHIETEKVIAYNFIPHFPISTVESHFGRLIFGKIGEKRIVAMQGRFHYYEGYSMKQIVFPVRIMKLLGIHTLFVSNASGSMNPEFKKGDLMIIDDHINLQGDNPLIGSNDDEFGDRFPDMSRPYDPELISRAEAIAKAENISLHKGVYLAVTGPQLETRAEYRFLRRTGADVVGMSTVPEVIAATHMGLRICAISVITDECDPDNLAKVTVQEIIAAAEEAEPQLTLLLKRLILELD